MRYSNLVFPEILDGAIERDGLTSDAGYVSNC